MNKEEEKYVQNQLRNSNDSNSATSRRSIGRSKYRISKQQRGAKPPVNRSIVKKTLVDLPEEILNNICWALRESQESLALSALRQTCKLFGRVTEEHLFHTIPIDLNQRNVYKAVAHAKHSRFLTMVKEVVIECEPAVQPMTYREWYNHVCSYGHFSLTSAVPVEGDFCWGRRVYEAALAGHRDAVRSQADFLEHWNIYQRCLKEQNLVAARGHDLVFQFFSIFSQLPNLQSVHVRAQSASKYALTNDGCRVRAVHRDSLTMPPFAPILESSFCSRYVMYLLKGLRCSQSHLRTICIDGLPPGTFCQVFMMDVNESPMLPELETVRVLLDSDATAMRWNGLPAVENLLFFIDGEIHPTVRVFDLQSRLLTASNASPTVAAGLNIESTEWPPLEVLRLHNTYAQYDTWKSIITQVGPSLRKLSITNCKLEGGYWTDLLEHLRDKAKNLQELDLKGTLKEFVHRGDIYTWEFPKLKPLRSLWQGDQPTNANLLHRYKSYLLRQTEERALVAWEKGGDREAWMASSDETMRYKSLS